MIKTRIIIKQLSHIKEHLTLALASLEKGDYLDTEVNINNVLGMLKSALENELERRRHND